MPRSDVDLSSDVSFEVDRVHTDEVSLDVDEPPIQSVDLLDGERFESLVEEHLDWVHGPFGGQMLDLVAAERLDRGRDAEAEAAFDRMYDEFSMRVVGLVQKFINDQDLVDDIVQETFLRGYNARLHLECSEESGGESQWPWLAAVARNLSLDALRKRSAVLEDELGQGVFDAEEPVDDPEVRYLATCRREGIAHAFEQVCPRQRRVMVLKDVYGWTVEDIAAREQISGHAVKSLLARARRTFRAAYDNIAESRGLGVVAGGVFTRAGTRLRLVRERMWGSPEAVTNTATASAGLANAAAGLVAGLIGAASVLGASGPPEYPEVAEAAPPPQVATAPVADSTAADLGEAPEYGPAPVEFEAEPVAEVSPASGPVSTDGSESPPADDSSSTDASLGTDDVVPPVDDGSSPNGGADGSVESDGDDVLVVVEQETDVDGDGEDDSENTGSMWVNCPPPEERSAVGSAACPAIETASQLS